MYVRMYVNMYAYVEGILPRESYPPCVSMAARALLAGDHRCMFIDISISDYLAYQ